MAAAQQGLAAKPTAVHEEQALWHRCWPAACACVACACKAPACRPRQAPPRSHNHTHPSPSQPPTVCAILSSIGMVCTWGSVSSTYLHKKTGQKTGGGCLAQGKGVREGQSIHDDDGKSGSQACTSPIAAQPQTHSTACIPQQAIGSHLHVRLGQQPLRLAALMPRCPLLQRIQLRCGTAGAVPVVCGEAGKEMRHMASSEEGTDKLLEAATVAAHWQQRRQQRWPTWPAPTAPPREPGRHRPAARSS